MASDSLNKVQLKTTLLAYDAADNKIKEIEKRLREMRKERSDLEDRILKIMDENKLKGKTINLGHVKIAYEEKTTKESFSQGFVKKVLEEYFIENYGTKYGESMALTKANELFQYLLNHRADKTSISLVKTDIKESK
jgi:hypothetical protein